MCAHALSFLVPGSIPSISEGDDLATVLLDALKREGEALQPGDIVVAAQTVVSKAEKKTVDLSTVSSSGAAKALAGKLARMPVCWK